MPTPVIEGRRDGGMVVVRIRQSLTVTVHKSDTGSPRPGEVGGGAGGEEEGQEEQFLLFVNQTTRCGNERNWAQRK